MSEAADELLELEKRLRDTLNSERAPVMGPCLEAIRSREPGLLQVDSLQIIRRILRTGKDSVKTLLFCLAQWPTLTVLLITEQVNQAYGEGNEYAVHAAIEELLGADSALSTSVRKKVWKAFRSACYHIGLKVSSRESGVGHMIGEFLHQAGLPLAFVDKVTHAMARTAHEVGLPDEDDPEAVARWQACLLTHMKYLPITSVRAIEADETGFYPRTFLRLFGTRGNPSSDTVEGIMARVLTEPKYLDGSGRWRRALRIPRLLLRNDELAVELPPGEDLEWVITVDGEEHTYRGGVGVETVPIMCVLPQHVSIASGTFSSTHVIWEDLADNRFQIFNSDGQWLRCAALGDAEIKLPPGDYVLVLRFQPSGFTEECHCACVEPDLYSMPLTLHPGATCELRRGPAQVTLAGEARPWIKFGGARLLAGGEPVSLCKGLSLEVAFGDTELDSSSTRRYAIHLSAEGKRIAQVPASDGVFSIEAISRELSPGLHRLVAELCPEGTERAITRSSTLVWTGLERQAENGVLHCSAWPQNLVASGCENASLSRENGQIGPRDRSAYFFRTEFTGTNGRISIFDWAVPGVFMEVEDYGVTPVVRRSFHAGSVLPLPPLTRQLLRIRSTEDGQLLLQGKKIRELVGGRGVSIHLSSIAERLDSGSGLLQFESRRMLPLEDLAQVVAPHQIFNFEQNRTPNHMVVAFQFAIPCSEIRCRLKNVITGLSLDLNAICDDPDTFSERFPMRLESGACADGLYSYRLEVDTSSMSPGAWIVDLEVCLAGRWGAPTNARQDSYCFGMLILRWGETSESLESVLECCSEPLDPNLLLDMLTGIHRDLQRCYALECWPGLGWLKSLWKRWLGMLVPLNRVRVQRLIAMCEMTPPESAAVSWLPLQRVESSLPELFAQPPDTYVGLQRTSRGMGLALSAVASAADFPGPLSLGVIDLYVTGGFGGLAKMMSGSPPYKFDFAEYGSGLLFSPLPESWPRDWQPKDGEFLGRTHYQVAWERLRTRYRETLTGNDIRRQYSLAMAHAVARQNRAPAVMLHRLEQKHSGAQIGDSIEESFLCEFETFLSALALDCRMDARVPGTLAASKDSLSRLRPDGSCSLSDLIGYLLQLGADMFGFYLLLWEIILVAKMDPTERAAHA